MKLQLQNNNEKVKKYVIYLNYQAKVTEKCFSTDQFKWLSIQF